MSWQGWMLVIGAVLAAVGLVAAWWRLTRRLARQEARKILDIHYRLLHKAPRPSLSETLTPPRGGRKLYEEGERKTDAP